MQPTQLTQLADKLRQIGGPMSGEETKFLRDFQGFIDFAIRNGLSFNASMRFLSHDWNVFAHSGFDFEEVMNQGFSPRVSGLNFGSDAAGEPEEAPATS